MIIWMLSSVLVALFITAAARAAEWLARVVGYRVRWIWAGALALTLVLSVSAALRGTRTVALPVAETSALSVQATKRAEGDASWTRALISRIDSFRRSLDASLQSGAVAVHRGVPPIANVYAVGFWSLASTALVGLLVTVWRRLRRARHEWPVADVQGVSVRVASRVGPVVIGFVRPEIVVPRWLLLRRADEQRLVVAHEDEHVRARDPLLLGLAWGAVAVMPWNPTVWYMLSRLRLAVELDCDARVLRRGAAPRSYGSLLIDVAENASALRLSALALADDSSHLHQRILAMKPHVPRFALVRGTVAGAFALVALVAACQATLPTDADIERMDVASATRTAKELARLKHADTAVAYMIDGAKATEAEALAIVPGALVRVEIVGGKDGNPSWIKLAKRKEALKAYTIAGSDSIKNGLRADTVLVNVAGERAGRGGRVGGPGPLSMKQLPFTGLVLIDGVRSTNAAMKALDPKQIETVEILKGAGAVAEYGTDAATGVIVITTKRGGGTE